MSLVVFAGDPVAVTVHGVAIARLAGVERGLAQPADFVAARIGHAALDCRALAGALGQCIDQRLRVTDDGVAEAKALAARLPMPIPVPVCDAAAPCTVV